MDTFRLEYPTLARKADALDYINEFREYNSEINGSGGLDRFTGDYEGWLLKLEADRKRIPDEKRVPSETYFLVRNGDGKIVGMINIRYALNERLKKYGGNIGYSTRPTERNKGYCKINLYLALKLCRLHGLKKVLLDANTDNPASWRAMEALGGVMLREYFDSEFDHCLVRDYEIDVDESLGRFSNIYEPMIKEK